MKRDSTRGAAIVEVIKSGNLPDLAKDYAEIGVDALTESQIASEIPIVKSVIAAFNTVGTIKDQILAGKLVRFISNLSELSSEERLKMIEDLNKSERYAGKVGATIIELLDRMESERKPELTARCFVFYVREIITFEELRRILLAIERMPSFDLDEIEKFSKYSESELMRLDEALALVFESSGLGRNNNGYSGGYTVPTKLCKLITKIGLIS